jgi:4-diphosphocytidyl-2-C-methyl-D-erythritol kinase
VDKTVAFAPAKLNLFLHVLGRRPDGYHELQTVFQLVDLRDELRIEVTRDGRITREPPAPGDALAQVPAAQDLAVRAARLLQPRAAAPLGARIALTKRIPMGGGLGGGSSDAATVLLALNSLWGLELPVDELAELGLELGADVPFFVRGVNAWAEGRGERLTPIETAPAWFLIVDPGVSVSTAAVFADPELTRDSPALRMRDFHTGATRNDCEPVVRRRFPEVAAALDALGALAPARLTGTGGCVFACFTDRVAAEAAAHRLGGRWRSFVARGLANRED